MCTYSSFFFFFFFNDTATTEIYTLSLHDALPIFLAIFQSPGRCLRAVWDRPWRGGMGREQPIQQPAPPDDLPDRKSTRLNSSHGYISYAVFCLKKKKTTLRNTTPHNASRTAHCEL